MKISQRALDRVREHAEAGYPEEICGILLGPVGGPVTQVRRARNRAPKKLRRRRYDIDSRDQRRIHKRAYELGLDVLGYYHSHPDHPAVASETDAEKSWTGYKYLISSCLDGKVVDHRLWISERDLKGPMREETLEVVDS
jgi:proteasome lid subunit RPN8/RPN11